MKLADKVQFVKDISLLNHITGDRLEVSAGTQGTLVSKKGENCVVGLSNDKRVGVHRDMIIEVSE